MAETKAPGILAGKRGLIMGVANNRSIAWGIAQAARQHGAELAFTYQGDALKKRVEPLAKELDAAVVGHCGSWWAIATSRTPRPSTRSSTR
jgi:enoyl-[acyl-carrier protein] reductase I